MTLRTGWLLLFWLTLLCIQMPSLGVFMTTYLLSKHHKLLTHRRAHRHTDRVQQRLAFEKRHATHRSSSTTPTKFGGSSLLHHHLTYSLSLSQYHPLVVAVVVELSATCHMDHQQHQRLQSLTCSSVRLTEYHRHLKVLSIIWIAHSLTSSPPLSVPSAAAASHVSPHSLAPPAVARFVPNAIAVADSRRIIDAAVRIITKQTVSYKSQSSLLFSCSLVFTLFHPCLQPMSAFNGPFIAALFRRNPATTSEHVVFKRLARVMHLRYAMYSGSIASSRLSYFICDASMTMATRLDLLDAMLTCIRENGAFQTTLKFYFQQPETLEPGDHIKADTQNAIIAALIGLTFDFQGRNYDCGSLIQALSPLALADMNVFPVAIRPSFFFQYRYLDLRTPILNVSSLQVQACLSTQIGVAQMIFQTFSLNATVPLLLTQCCFSHLLGASVSRCM